MDWFWAVLPNRFRDVAGLPPNRYRIGTSGGAQGWGCAPPAFGSPLYRDLGHGRSPELRPYGVLGRSAPLRGRPLVVGHLRRPLRKAGRRAT